MKFRVARHTTDLQPILAFYRDLLGLKVLGGFTAHNGYDGVFLGPENADWHLEFTVSNYPPTHVPDDDDLLVFYLALPAEYERLKAGFARQGIAAVAAKNPYWQEFGTTYHDPDGFGVVITAARPAAL